MSKRRNNRHVLAAKSIDPYANLAADIIVDALLIASGQGAASDKERAEARHWLHGEMCQRWADVIGVDIRVALSHKSCILEGIKNANRP